MFTSCGPKVQVDKIIIAQKIYSVDASFNTFQAIAISDDTIVAIGSEKGIKSRYDANELIDLSKNILTPGLIDAHCHFVAYGRDQNELDLKSVTSFDDLIEKVTQYASLQERTFIIGRGWNEENWVSKTRPSNYKLNFLFPETPVVLQRIDGHAALVNQAALDLAGITPTTVISGGHIELINGIPTGLVVDAALEKVLDILPELSDQEFARGILMAQKDCFQKGLTTVSDAGLPMKSIHLLDSLQKSGDLKMRIYAMANPDRSALEQAYPKGPVFKENLVVASVKLYCDGSLGSRGAWLKEPYCDDSLNTGLPQDSLGYYLDWAQWCKANGFQMNTHCIGNRANKEILSIYSQVLEKDNDDRWRIEHAQVVDHEDMHYFKDYSILASIQPTHAVSDMYMAKKRLCSSERLAGAYAYKDLLDSTGILPLGTDFPVESIDPLGTYYAAVLRMNKKRDVFREDQKLDAISTLRGMTIWAAKSNKMEEWVGSLEVGKKADLTVLSGDLLQSRNFNDGIKVLGTMSGGEWVYGPNN